MCGLAVEPAEFGTEVRGYAPDDPVHAVQVGRGAHRSASIWSRNQRAAREDTMPASAYITVFGHEIKYTFGMRLRYNYRLYPAPGQQQALARAFGCARVEAGAGALQRTESVIGIDLGLKHFAILSDGRKIASP